MSIPWGSLLEPKDERERRLRIEKEEEVYRDVVVPAMGCRGWITLFVALSLTALFIIFWVKAAP